MTSLDNNQDAIQKKKQQNSKNSQKPIRSLRIFTQAITTTKTYKILSLSSDFSVLDFCFLLISLMYNL